MLNEENSNEILTPPPLHDPNTLQLQASNIGWRSTIDVKVSHRLCYQILYVFIDPQRALGGGKLSCSSFFKYLQAPFD